MTNIKSLFAGLLVASSLVYGASAAQAGEVGVSNRYSDGYSNSKTHVDFESYEVHKGIEANVATADKKFTSGSYTPAYYDYTTHTYVPSSSESEVVHSASAFVSGGTYFTEDTAEGYTDSKSYSAFTEHTTSAFSNP